MIRHLLRPRPALALGVSATAALAALAGAPAAHAASRASADLTLTYSGNAYGTTAFVGSTVVSGRSAFITLGCSPAAGTTNTNTAAGVSAPPALASGTINTSVSAQAGPVSQSIAEVQNVSLLGGVITADAVTAESTTSYSSGSGFTLDPTGSSFLNLAINGVPQSAAPPPNTSVPLPGIGFVVFNEQLTNTQASSAQLVVNMIHVYVTASTPAAPAGTQVIVSHASSDLEPLHAGPLDGRAYGTLLRVGTTVESGPSFLQPMPCAGTRGIVRTNGGLGITLPSAGTTGTITDTAQGTVTRTTAAGTTSSTVQTVNLLGGLITADLVSSVANASESGGTVTLSETGSTFENLVVNGTPISNPVAPNTEYSFQGFTVILNEVIQKSNQIEVRMIEVLVTGSNPAGLPLKADLRVAVASASVGG